MTSFLSVLSSHGPELLQYFRPSATPLSVETALKDTLASFSCLIAVSRQQSPLALVSPLKTEIVLGGMPQSRLGPPPPLHTLETLDTIDDH